MATPLWYERCSCGRPASCTLLLMARPPKLPAGSTRPGHDGPGHTIEIAQLAADSGTRPTPEQAALLKQIRTADVQR